jgi:hypothetical protein
VPELGKGPSTESKLMNYDFDTCGLAPNHFLLNTRGFVDVYLIKGTARGSRPPSLPAMATPSANITWQYRYISFVSPVRPLYVNPTFRPTLTL